MTISIQPEKSNVQWENVPLEVTSTEVFPFSSTPTSQIPSQIAMLSVSLWGGEKNREKMLDSDTNIKAPKNLKGNLT